MSDRLTFRLGRDLFTMLVILIALGRANVQNKLSDRGYAPSLILRFFAI